MDANQSIPVCPNPECLSPHTRKIQDTKRETVYKCFACGREFGQGLLFDLTPFVAAAHVGKVQMRTDFETGQRGLFE